MSIWTILWVLWIVAFFLIEAVAIVKDLDDFEARTLSNHFRRWFHTDTHLGRTIWLAVSGVFFAWFVVHIAVAGSI